MFELICVAGFFGATLTAALWLNRGESRTARLCVFGPKKVLTTTFHTLNPGGRAKDRTKVVEVY